ncbi:MAG: hypothetical protein LBR67_07130 [Dysgonamonadaceae bacterium]|jgi:hypothetical protein|nr:hypothetical protein [Dysgonamonadaceae bacterium]
MGKNMLESPQTKPDRLPGVEYNPDGSPVGITLEEWMDRLGQKLIDHYGEDFRAQLNAARVAEGMRPI